MLVTRSSIARSAGSRTVTTAFGHVVGMLALAACSSAATPTNHAPVSLPTPRTMAITIDDLPGFGQLAAADSPERANRRLLAALSDRGVRATGFVNCANTAPTDPVLRSWLDRGLELGNHTSHHLDLHTTHPAVWVADVESCHQHLLQLGAKPRYFRYPMLHQGVDATQREAAKSVLSRLGYSIAHVSIDNSEWILAQAYGQALADADPSRADDVARAYLQHMLSAVEHFDEVAEGEFGRLVPHVLLIHANALAADHVGGLLDALAEKGVAFVSLSSALADPVYARPDTYTGPKGLSWFYRTSPDAVHRWGDWDETESARITAKFIGAYGELFPDLTL